MKFMVGVLAKDPSLYADLVPHLSNYNYISLGSAREHQIHNYSL